MLQVPPQPDNEIFERGPTHKLQRRLGLIKGEDLHVVRRAILVILVGWAPLVLLTLVQNIVIDQNGFTALMGEVGAHARYLLAAPLLILAESQCATRLSAIVRHFVDGGIVPDHERGRFDAAVASTRKLLDSTVADIVIIALAYLVVTTSVYSIPLDQIPAWHKAGGVASRYSLAGWWHVLVSLPLLIVLVLGWLWRLAAWARLLRLIARLDLRLVVSHPDHAAGLGFVGNSVRAFSIVALALAIIPAARSAQLVLNGSALPTFNLTFNIGFVAFVVALCAAPLLAFMPTLSKAWRRARFEYDALADRVGSAFEDKWLGHDRQDGGAAVKMTGDMADFSATTDLYSIVANAYALRFVPIDTDSLVAFGGTTLLPFIPVVLLAVPMDVIWSGIQALLF